MTRVIHTGDTHLGYRQYHRPERKQDFLDAFTQVADDAVDDDVDAVVHAGDLFHDRRPNLGDIMGALSVLRTLDGADVPFLAVVGNHEAKRSGQWLDLFESLGLATRLGDEPESIGDTAFYGLDFVPRAQRDDFEPDFEDHDVGHAALVTHGLFGPFEFGEWDPREILSPADVDFDALLLGDNHDSGTAEVEDTWVTYCGSTERASAAEREDRGYNLVSFDGDVDIRRRSLDTREFVFVDVELGSGEGAERVRERVGQYDLDDAVVVIRIEGDGEPIAPAHVEEYALDHGALVARVTDHREFPEEAEREISFADPDEAVRERVRDLGLSSAAREIDETVRASKVADSNVDTVVESRVEELVAEGDPSEFEGVDTVDDDGPGTESRAADSADDDAAVDAQTETEPASASADDEGETSATAQADAAATDAVETEETADAGVDPESEAESESTTASADGADGSDGTLEDFL